MSKKGSKPGLVFLHGLALDGRAYHHGLDKLRDRYGIYAPDMLRARGSEPCIEEFAAYVVKKVEDEKLPTPFYIAGHSMGGGVAIRIAYDHPELVSGLVLMNSIGTRLGASWPQLIHAGLTTMWPGAREFGPLTETLVKNWLTHPQTLAALISHKVKAVNLEEEIRAVRGVPAVVIHAEGDRVIDAEHSELLAQMMGVPLQVVPGNHGWMFHNWNAFASILDSAVTSMSGAPCPRVWSAQQRVALSGSPRAHTRVATA